MLTFFALKDAVVSPCPSATQSEFLLSTRRGIRVVQVGGCEDYTEFSKKFVEDIVAVRESGELDAVAVDIAHGCLVTGNDQFSKVAQGGGIAAKELNQRVRILQRT